MLKYGGKTDIGMKRNNNQDVFYISDIEEIPLVLVADGMGGHSSGELASSMCRDYIVKYILENRDELNSSNKIEKTIKEAIENANTNIYLKSQSKDELKGMGTTLTMAYIYKEKVYLGHVGDSRAYIIDDSIRQITEDHSYVNELIKIGDITKEEARNHPKKNMITRAVGSSSILEVDLYNEDFKKDNIVILTSDGVTNHILDEELFDIFKNEEDIQIACNKTIEMANNNGGTDNITIVAVKL